MSNLYISGCDLVVPYKQPKTDDEHSANMLAIERWAHHYRMNCGGGCECQAIRVSGTIEDDLNAANDFQSIALTEIPTNRQSWSHPDYRYGEWTYSPYDYRNDSSPGGWLIGGSINYTGPVIGNDPIKLLFQMPWLTEEVISIPTLDGNGFQCSMSGFSPVLDSQLFYLYGSVLIKSPSSHDRTLEGGRWACDLWAVKVCACGPGAMGSG